MKYLEALILCLLISCNKTDSFKTFNNLKDFNFVEFKNISIIYRYGTYVLTMGKTEPIFIRKGLVNNKITQIWTANQKDIHKTKEETQTIEELLMSFDKLKVMTLSVDDKDNVRFSYIADRKCTYYFLKLSPKNTLSDINKSSYKRYSDNWYLKIECSE